MNVNFRCDCCGHQQSVDEFHIGKVVRCPKCENVGVVPASGRIYDLNVSESGRSSGLVSGGPRGPVSNGSVGNNVRPNNAPSASSPWAGHPGYLDSDEIAPEPSERYGNQPQSTTPAVADSGIPYTPTNEGRCGLVRKAFRFATSNLVLAGACVASIMLFDEVGHGARGPIPVGTYVAGGALALSVVALIRRVVVKDVGNKYFPIMLAGLAAYCMFQANKNYKAERYNYQIEQHQPKGSNPHKLNYRISVDGNFDQDFDQQRHPEYDFETRYDVQADEAMRRTEQSWWPEHYLRELPATDKDREYLIAAANLVLTCSPLYSEAGEAALLMPYAHTDLMVSLAQADRNLMYPKNGTYHMRFVRMWKNAFRVLMFKGSDRTWSSAVEVTVKNDGTMEYGFYQLAPEAGLPTAQRVGY